MKYLSYVIVACAGISSALQGALNAELRKGLLSPWTAGLMICLIEVIAFAALYFIFHPQLPSREEVLKIPWYTWIAALLGCFIIYATFEVTKKVGSGTFNAIFVTASLIMAISLDHFALLGLKQHPAGLGRLLGALLMIAGVILISMF